MVDQRLLVLEGILDAWRDGRLARDLMSPDIEYVNPPDALELGTRTGASAFNLITDVYDWRIEQATYFDAGADILMIVSGHARAKGSGIEGPFNQGYIWTVENGVATRFRWFTSPDDAFAAAGVNPKAEPLGLDHPA